VVIRSNAYRIDGPWTLSVAPHSTGVLHWNLEQSSNWYDFTVQAPSIERRFAGRMETGQNSFSDPAMGQNLASLVEVRRAANP
jgi:phospholipase C